MGKLSLQSLLNVFVRVEGLSLFSFLMDDGFSSIKVDESFSTISAAFVLRHIFHDVFVSICHDVFFSRGVFKFWKSISVILLLFLFIC